MIDHTTLTHSDVKPSQGTTQTPMDRGAYQTLRSATGTSGPRTGSDDVMCYYVASSNREGCPQTCKDTHPQ